MKPVSARLPVSAISFSSPMVCSISSHSAWVRWSFQRIAGRSGLIVVRPARPARASARSGRCRPVRRRLRSACARTVSVARHQSSGSCSAQPGRGVDSGYSASTRARTSPSGSMATPLAALVPTSIPNSAVIGGVDLARPEALGERDAAATRHGLGKKLVTMSRFLPEGSMRRSLRWRRGRTGTSPGSSCLISGSTTHAIAYRVKIGRLFRVFRGVYSVGRRPITVQEWAQRRRAGVRLGCRAQPRVGDGALGVLAPLGDADRGDGRGRPPDHGDPRAPIDHAAPARRDHATRHPRHHAGDRQRWTCLRG